MKNNHPLLHLTRRVEEKIPDKQRKVICPAAHRKERARHDPPLHKTLAKQKNPYNIHNTDGKNSHENLPTPLTPKAEEEAVRA